MKRLLSALFIFNSVISFAVENNPKEPKFIAIEHASFIIKAAGLNIFVDPVGNEAQYTSYGKPDIILITHEHGDHLNIPLINTIKTDKTEIIGTKTVIDKTGFGKILKNNEKISIQNINIEALPAYNITTERLKYHPKGQGNSYLITIGNKRIYISGDTENVAELESITNVDYAFICMNLPYTMSVEQAADLIVKMKPRNIYPYHYRNQDRTFTDIHQKLTSLIPSDLNLKIHYLDWYK